MAIKCHFKNKKTRRKKVKKENKENKELTRRSFITKGAAAAAVSSIIAIPALAAQNSEEVKAIAGNNAAMLGNDPVYTDDVQTLTNKTISAADNTLIIGTDAVNIKEYPITGTDITSALNSALSAVSSGGTVLIPQGTWETDGGHSMPHAVTIEGMGFNAGVTTIGTMVKLKSGSSNTYMFKLVADRRNVSFKNFGINLTDKPTATGILMTNAGCSAGGYETCSFIYSTCIENLGIYGGTYGIKVDSSSGTQFECILNRFERVMFIGCRTGFYCNTVNSGFTFDNCYFYIPTSGGGYSTGGIALECYVVGNIALDHCLFVGTQANGPLVPPTDGSIILKTVGLFNNISFFDCQDENVQYAYQNSTNPWEVVSLVYKNCLIQSHFQFNAHGKVTLDSCRCAGTVYDSSGVVAKLYLKGVWNFFGYDVSDPNNPQQVTYESPESHVDFSNVYSQIIYENLEVNAPMIKVASDTTTSNYVVVNATRGAVTVLSGASYVQVYNNTVTPNSLIFLQLRTYDSGGARIREVDTYTDYFMIYLTQNAASNLSIAFMVEG